MAVASPKTEKKLSKDGNKRETWGDIVRDLRLQGLVLFGLLAVMWSSEIIDTALRGRLDAFGVRPRSIEGLGGILFAPFLHGGFPHLIANSLPFLILGGLVMLWGFRQFLAVTVGATLLGGLGVWLVGSAHSVHIGASGVIFGYLGFLLLAGWFDRRFGTILISLVVGLFYGGLVLGVLPNTPGVSWESHLFGFLSGAWMAWLFARLGRRARRIASR